MVKCLHNECNTSQWNCTIFPTIKVFVSFQCVKPLYFKPSCYVASGTRHLQRRDKEENGRKTRILTLTLDMCNCLWEVQGGQQLAQQQESSVCAVGGVRAEAQR